MPRWLTFALFLAIVIAVLGGIHFYLWARWVRDPAWPAAWRRGLTVALWTLCLGVPTTLVLARGLPVAGARALAWPAYTWLGLMFVGFVLLLVIDFGRAAAWIASRVAGGEPESMERRRLFARLLAGGAFGATAAVGAWGVRTALREVAVTEIDVPLRRLPAAASGLTIVQLTDLHVGPTIGRDLVEDVVQRTNALEPDLVAITGDLVDGSVPRLRNAVEPLGALRARHGVFFVTGNHEYYAGVKEWMAELARLGIRVLRNERVSIGEGDASFDLAGVDDWSAARSGPPDHAADLPKALAGRDPSRELVLLAHQPRAIHQAAEHGVGLQLSGHTHAGQVWPFTLLVRLVQPYVAGLHRHGDTWIYVSPGTGYWGPPMRVATAPEITRITLRASA